MSVQDRHAPASTCFGCGPANPAGLHLQSHSGDNGTLVASWLARPEHEAFSGVLNGGIIGTLLDCHGNWAAALHLLESTGAAELPSTVTADLAVRFLRPPPTDGPVTLRAHVVEASERRATVDAELERDGAVCATARATYVAVGPDHPAYGRWRGG